MKEQLLTGQPTDPWHLLALPTPIEAIDWRADGKTIERNGQLIQRFVPFVSAHYVRSQLDAIVPGWTVELEPLPPQAPILDPRDGKVRTPAQAGFLATIRIGTVTRSDVGTGDDYKSAATDAFKRAGVRCGIAADLYEYGQNWVPVDAKGRPMEDPSAVYQRRLGSSGAAFRAPGGTAPVAGQGRPEDVGVPRSPQGAILPAPHGGERSASSPTPRGDARADAPGASDGAAFLFSCPVCGGKEYWDNRFDKRNPRAPDYKCKRKGCDGAVWLTEKDGTRKSKDDVKAEQWLGRMQQQSEQRQGQGDATSATALADDDQFPPPLEDDISDLDLPF